MLKKIIDQLKQPSTLKGLLVLISLAGINLTDVQSAAVIQGVLALLGVYEVFRQEKK
jgi:hypothetical protein